MDEDTVFNRQLGGKPFRYAEPPAPPEVAMSFQFQCPQGHLLEGDTSQAGQAVHCPMCGMLFLIPAPLAPPPRTEPVFVPAFGPFGEPAPSRFAHLEVAARPDAVADVPFQPDPQVMETPAAPDEPAEPEVLHIPCPNGHELETPLDMLEQDVLCPRCNVQFHLRRIDSVEYQRKQKEAERIQEIRTANFWLNAAIVAVVLVGLLVTGLIAMTIFSGTK
jgi:hypothetical protein